MKREEWKDVVNFEGLYKISSSGRLKRIGGSVISPVINPGGYAQVAPCKNGKNHMKYVHRIVLENFIGPCPDGMECRHLDGDKLNNNLSNLAWGTHAENIADKVAHGTLASGESHHSCKLSDFGARVVMRLLDIGTMNQSEIAEVFGVSKALVSMVNMRTARFSANV